MGRDFLIGYGALLFVCWILLMLFGIRELVEWLCRRTENAVITDVPAPETYLPMFTSSDVSQDGDIHAHLRCGICGETTCVTDQLPCAGNVEFGCNHKERPLCSECVLVGCVECRDDYAESAEAIR